MRSLFAVAALLLSAAPAAAQGIAFCPSSTELEYRRWARDGVAEAGVVSLVGPLSDESVREIDLPDEAPTFQCDGDGGPTVEEEAAGTDGAGPGPKPPLLVTCSQILLSSPGGQTSGHNLGLWTGGRTEDGEDVFYVVSSVEPDAGSGQFVLRVVLRERVSERVERELVLLEADCAESGEPARDE